MAHHCHATNCKKPVPEAMFMCSRHWFTLPKGLRDRIWLTYRRGQENDKEPSSAYCEAAKAAVTFIAQKEGITPDVRLYEPYASRGAMGAYWRVLEEMRVLDESRRPARRPGPVRPR